MAIRLRRRAGAGEVRGMFDVETYLRRLDFSGNAERSWETLRDLHKRHLVSVAFDNSDSIARRVAPEDLLDIGADGTFDRIVREGRGGTCTALNGLFRRLLGSLGFDVARLSAGVCQQSGSYSPD